MNREFSSTFRTEAAALQLITSEQARGTDKVSEAEGEHDLHSLPVGVEIRPEGV